MFERSLEIEPNYGAYSNLGAIYYYEARYTDAAVMYEKALELDDQDYRVWMNLASAYYWTSGQREKGLATYRKTIQMAEEYRTINPGNREVLAHLAECYVPVGEQDLALSLIEQALSLEPDNIDFMVRAGLVYEVLGERDKALECIGKALDQGYPVEAIEGVPELEPLLNDPRFELIRGQKEI
jgi:tetratricopeptide (TPR) repeat protein